MILNLHTTHLHAVLAALALIVTACPAEVYSTSEESSTDAPGTSTDTSGSSTAIDTPTTTQDPSTTGHLHQRHERPG
jgi:hypothetical protein